MSVYTGSSKSEYIKYGSNSVVNGGKGNDTLYGYNNYYGSNNINNVIFLYANGDGNDSIVGFNETSTLRISDANYSTAKSGNDIIVTVGEGQITLKGAAKLSTVNIIANDKSIVAVDGMCYSSLQEAINALVQKKYGTLTLLKDCAGSFDFSTGNNKLSFSVDLNGKTLTATDTLKFNGNAGVTFKNGTITSTGNVSILIDNDGCRLNFYDGVTLDATKLKADGYIIDTTGGKLYFDGSDVYSDYATIRNAGGEIEINCYDCDGDDEYFYYYYERLTQIPTHTFKANILFSGSELPEGYSLELYRDNTIDGDLLFDSAALNAGTLTNIILRSGDSFTKNPAITMDNFSNLVKRKVAGTSDIYSLETASNPNNTSYVASLIINGNITYYTSLETAMTVAAQSKTNGTLTLLKDCAGTIDFSNFVHSENKTYPYGYFDGYEHYYYSTYCGSDRFTVNLNGHTFTATDTIKLGDKAWVTIKNGTLTSTSNVSTLIENNGGELDFHNANIDATKLKSGGYIANNNGGTLIFEAASSVNSKNSRRIKSTSGELIIDNSNDATIKADILLCDNESSDYRYNNFVFGSGTIDGDLFLDSTAVANGIWKGKYGDDYGKIYIGENATFTKNANLINGNLNALITKANGSDGIFKLALPSLGSNVAYVYNYYKDTVTFYKTIQEAIDVVAANKDSYNTVILLKDCSGTIDLTNLSSKSYGCSINLNGHTFTATNTIKLGDKAWVTIKNGTLTSTSNVSTLIENNGGELDFQSANIDATKLKSGGYIIDSPKGSLYFNRVNVDSNNGTIASNMLTSYGSTIKADILWNNSSVDLRRTTVEGDLFIDEKCIPYYWYWAEAGLFDEECISVRNSTFTKNPLITAENIGSLVAYPISKGKGKLGLTYGGEVSTVGTADADDIHNTVEGTKIQAYGGDDIIYNEVSNVTIDAGAGDDLISNTVLFNSDEDYYEDEDIYIGPTIGNASIKAGDGDDTVYNSASSVTIDGGAGNDSIISSSASVSINSGDGNDFIGTFGREYDSLSTVTINAGKGDDTIGRNGDWIVDEYSDYGDDDYYDYFSGNMIKFLIQYKAGDGNDIIYGFRADSTLSIAGGTYSKTVSGADIIVTVGDNEITISGAASLSTVNILGEEVSIVKPNFKTETFDNSSAAKVTLASSIDIGDASKRTKAIQITGNAKANSILGGTKNDTLAGGNGNDTINGGAGNDNLIGGNGDDTFMGDADKDIFVVSGGNDTIIDYDPADKISLGSAQVQGFRVSGKDVTFNLGTNQSLTLKDAAGKKITFAEGKKSTVNIYTEDGIVNSAETAITLDAATKTFTADSKLVTIDGSLTNGVAITGNSKANLLIGGNGDDTFMGDADKDIFVVSGGNDTIIDYDPADKISLGSAQVQGFRVSGKDVTFNLGTNQSLTLKDAAGKKITFAEGKKSTVNIYTEDGLINSAETAITLDTATKTFTADSKLVTIDGSLTNGVAITGNTKANLLIGDKGSDTFIYTAGAGNDIISNYGAGDKISIVGATVTDANVNKNGHSVIKVGKNSITVKNSSEVTLVDSSGEKLFSSGIFYNAGKTSATLPASFSAKGTTKLDARTIDATLVSKAVNITGNDAANSILGSVKNDTLYGGAGNDNLRGGAGNDSLWGDAGADKFLYDNGDGKDIIFSFDNTDMLQITGDWSAAYVAKSKTIAFKVGDTANAITLKDFTTTLFNVNGYTYTISGSKLVKK